MIPPAVTVIAATGQLGQALVRRLLAAGIPVVAIGRDAAKLAALPAGCTTRLADLDDAAALKTALGDARIVASCTNARFVPALLAALPPGVERLVIMGSTRCFSRIPDPTAEAVRRAIPALAASGLPHCLLLASLIYGGEIGVVQSLIRLGRRLPILPVPGGAGIRVQPIHIEDVAASLLAAINRPDALGTPVIIAGPEPLPYAGMVRLALRGAGLKTWVLPIPAGLLRLAAALAGPVPGLRGVAAALGRLVEDRAYDISDMRRRLCVEPRPFQGF